MYRFFGIPGMTLAVFTPLLTWEGHSEGIVSCLDIPPKMIAIHLAAPNVPAIYKTFMVLSAKAK